jgi:hypothetical protein
MVKRPTMSKGLLILASLSLMAALASSQPGTPDCSLKIEPDGTATVRGVVRRNVLGCVVDTVCLLKVWCKDSDVSIPYQIGRRRTLGNVPRDAVEIESGAVIEAHGAHQAGKSRNGQPGHQIDVTSNESFVGLVFYNSRL